ncbi:MAG: hypothetical protein KF878_18240 [Planctomycetes bacterium]|nr:hypothetical protein [Planctomycetota bacterium]
MDPLDDVRRLVDALRARAPGDPAARLLHAAVAATDQLRQLDPAEALRRVEAAIRVLGVLTPDPDTRSHVRPGTAGRTRPATDATSAAERTATGDAPAGDDRTCQAADAPDLAGQDPAGPDRPSTGTAGRARPSTGTAGRARPSTGTAGRARPSTGAAGQDRPSAGTAGRARPGSDATPGRAGARTEAAVHRASVSRTGPWSGPAPSPSEPVPGTRSGRRSAESPVGRPPDAAVGAGVSDLARAWAELGRGVLPSEPIELLGELVRTGVPEGAEAVRFHLALVRGLDHALLAARHLPCEGALVARARPLLRAAIAGARALGVAVHPAPDDPRAPAPCPVTVLPAFGPAPGELVHVEQHGFLMADGRSEPSVLRIASEPPPPWLDALLEGYAAVLAAAALVVDGAAQARAYRGWLDELPGVTDLERRATTLRYAATAVFGAAEALPAARGAFGRLAQALEGAGSYVIPLEEAALSDGRRYELVLRPGVGTPRVVRPGFLGPGQVVQQRARVLADPAWLGTMST